MFHLVVVTVLANSGSFLSRQLQSWILPYGNQFGFNSTWNFFSPDPAHTMYIQYKLYENEDSDQPLLTGFIPEGKNKISVNSAERRTLYFARYLLLDPARIDKFLLPWLCQINKSAHSLEIKNVTETIPYLDSALFNADNDREVSKSQGMKLECQ